MYDENLGEYIGRNGVIELTKSESIILRLLIERKGHVITYEELIKNIYGCRPDKYLIKNINCKMTRLRKKVKGEFVISTRKDWGYFIR